METEKTYLYCNKCGQKIHGYLIKHWILKHPGEIEWQKPVGTVANPPLEK